MRAAVQWGECPGQDAGATARQGSSLCSDSHAAAPPPSPQDRIKNPIIKQLISPVSPLCGRRTTRSPSCEEISSDTAMKAAQR